MCDPSQCKGNLKVRSDWSIKVQDFFVNNSAMEFVRSTFDFVDAPYLHGKYNSSNQGSVYVPAVM